MDLVGLWFSKLAWLEEHIQYAFTIWSAELVSALSIGTSISSDSELSLLFKTIGIYHVLVVSGFHIGLVSNQVHQLTAGFGRIQRLLIWGVLLALYILLVGARPPAMRAGTMLLISQLSLILLGRKGQKYLFLLIAGSLMLLLYPAWITSVSWQLSFLATFCVYWVSDIFSFFNLQAKVGDILLEKSVMGYSFSKLEFNPITFFLSEALFSGAVTLLLTPYLSAVFGSWTLNGILVLALLGSVVPLLVRWAWFSVGVVVATAVFSVTVPTVVLEMPYQLFLDVAFWFQQRLPPLYEYQLSQQSAVTFYSAVAYAFVLWQWFVHKRWRWQLFKLRSTSFQHF